MLAFTFPGQGSQRPGMGRPWTDHESWELVDEASEVADRDVARLLLDADAEELKDTRNAQLTTFVSSLMVLDAAERLGPEPSFCAGHSLGEYTALTATGALGFDEGVRLVCERADAMYQAGIENPGTMAAVLGLDDDLVEVACRRADSDVWVANFNAPGQVVIAGSKEGVAAAGAVAKELGAKRVMSLPVSGAFHTPFMTAGPRPVAQGDRRSQSTRHRGAGDLQRRRPPSRHRRRVVEPAVGTAEQPGALEALPARAGRSRRHRTRRARPWRRVDRYGQAHRRVGAHDRRSRPPKTWKSCSSGSTPVRTEAAPSTKASTCSPANAWSSAPRRGCSRPSPACPMVPSSRSAPCSAGSAMPRCARRSPVFCRATSPSTASESQ